MVFFKQYEGEDPKPLPAGYYLISRGKLAGPGTHYGLLEITLMTQFQQDQVFDLQTTGYRVISFDDFAQGKEVTIHEGKPPSAAAEILERARNVPRWKPAYDILANNCEHAARFVYSGKHESTQIAGLAALGVVGVILFIVSKAKV